MWPYYGCKVKMIDLYPAPKRDKIVEPFAGTARYSLKYFDRDVLLVDKYDVIIKIWKWLQQCSPADILKLPRLKEGERVSSYKFDCEEAALLMGFLVVKGVESPRDTAVYRATTERPRLMGQRLKFIADNLFKIKHWKIELGSYEDIPNQNATWFIDPPYQVGGSYYKHNNKGWDYSRLAEWCQARHGHVIVCENTGANWLPFYPMRKLNGSYRTTTEAIWSNYPHNFMARQKSLFDHRP
jgi:hypothetical protein